MTALPEHEIRDLLAEQLDVLEPGLTLVRREFPLSDRPLHTRGKIDILARDRHGLWVIIELKRSTSTSREALHEVAKYAELLQRDKQVAPDRIRALIVSTDWRELLVPVSNMARDWSHDLRGYELQVHEDRTLSVERVSLLPTPVEQYVTPVHCIYLYATPQDRDRGWRHIQRVATEIGAPHLLAADFDRVNDMDTVVAHYGLYLGIGTVEWGSVLSDASEAEGYAAEHPAEYEALCEINARVRCVSVESAHPGVLDTLLDNPNWDITGYRGAGAFAVNNGAFEERDWLLMLAGHDRGDGHVKFIGAVNRRIASRWRSFVEQAMTSLGGNPVWEVLVRAWLERVAQQPGDIDVFLWIYNPCDLIQTVVYGWPDELARWEPRITAVASFSDGSSSVVEGRLCTNSMGGAPGFHHFAHEVYSDPVSWMVTRYGGATWVSDLDLVRRLGLTYTFLEITSDHSGGPAPGDERGLWLVEDGRASRYSSNDPEFLMALQLNTYRGDFVPLHDFLKMYCHEVNALRIEYLTCLDIRR
ncbi:endonuclease NucS domain-containing protein [Streptacidiphilus albus]|uniref:endonuclease NucS domain-containing protein n=1 Tax=Streptacidiphilus albus TaxID=105425 RepID=UPI001364D423|nr:endonuclease NucS domain-containing protein [Streptacidiphilus albus]